MSRFTAAGALVTSIGRNGDVTHACKFFSKKTDNLFFHAAVRVSNNDGRIGFLRIVTGRSVDVCGNANSVNSIGNRMNIYFTDNIFCNCIVVYQAVRILEKSAATAE